MLHDDRGNMVEGACLMANDQPVLSCRRKYDEYDRQLRNVLWPQRTFCLGSAPGFLVILTYDAEGNVTRIAVFDENGKAMSGT